MHQVRHEFHVAVSAPSPSVLAEGMLVGKPLDQEPQVVDSGVIRGLHVPRTLLDVAVVPDEKRDERCDGGIGGPGQTDVAEVNLSFTRPTRFGVGSYCSYMAMAQNADQQKRRQIRISAVPAKR